MSNSERPDSLVRYSPELRTRHWLTALAGFFHYVRVGRNEIDERDEAAAQQDAGAREKRNPEKRP